MVFSSFPTYPDPSNWQHQTIIPPPQPQPPHGGGDGGRSTGSSVRPGSMAERARQANITMPEAALKCPRCESTNTKFCYFNNYNLSQPRHFCKTCRRYWTRGGALRTVPVGGGCRKNKRSKSSSGRGNNSSSTSSRSQDSNPIVGPTTSSMSSMLSSYNTGSDTSHDRGIGPVSSLPLDPHHEFTIFQYGAVSGSYEHHQHHPRPDLTASGLLSGLEQWRFPASQLPLLGGLEMASPSLSSGLYPFDYQMGMDSSYGVNGSSHFRAKNIFHNISSSSSSSAAAAMDTAAASQLASVKAKDNKNNQDRQLNMSRQLLGNTEQFWNVSAAIASSWSDVSNVSSSSTSNPL